MRSSACNEILSGLNDSQKAAVTTKARACLILAGPGSGKTHTITARIRYLIRCRGVPPEKILVITFTKDAAISMQKRFYESENSIYPVVFGTFHSIFYSILRESKGYSSKKLLSDSYKKSVFSKIISEIIPEKDLKKHSASPGEYAPEFISAVSFYKNTSDFEGAKELLCKENRDYFDLVYHSYEDQRSLDKMIDFDDMVFDCCEMLKNDKTVSEYWQQRFDHILIDEYQDINKRQFETVSRLLSDKTCIFAVGDDDQSIYGFRGSEPGCMRMFSEKYNAEIIDLEINYRSGQHIIDIAERIIGENKDRYIKHQSAYKENPFGKVIVKNFKDKTTEYDDISRMILTNDSKKGILFRTNLEMQSFASYLTKKGIEYHIRDKSACVYDHPAAMDMIAYLKVANGCGRDDIIRIINKPQRFIGREAVADGNIDAAIKYYYRSDKYKADERVRNLKRFKEDLDFLSGKDLYLQIRYIRNKIGLDRFYKENFRNKQICDEYISVLDHITSECKNFEGLDEWLAYMDIYREELVKNQKSGKGENKDVPQLMTVHASKGLEFDEVYIPDVNEGNYPHGKMLDKKLAEEERRVFYVAVTRAKTMLYLSFIKEEGSGNLLPSRFLNPLKDML